MDFPNCVNYSVKLDGNNKVIEKSMLINVRGSELGVVIATFNSMRGRLNGDLAGAALPRLPEVRPQVMVLEPEEHQRSNNPGPCERCGAAMVLKIARKGPRIGQQFWACCAYSKGCLSTKPA
jgi:hypothetical protein